MVIVGTPKYIVYASDNYAVIRCSLDDGTSATVVGEVPTTKDVKIKFSGDWAVDKKYGRQFKATSYEIPLPTDKAGIVAYLKSLKCGIGKSWAERIYTRFGAKTWDILEKNPNELLNIKGFGQKRLNNLTKMMNETRVTRAVMAVFNGVMEISASKAKTIANTLGEAAIEIIKNNPYALFKVHGLGFSTVDNIAKHFNGKPDDRLRIEGAIFTILEREETHGHSCVQRNKLVDNAYNLLNYGYSTEVVSIALCHTIIDNMINCALCMCEFVKRGEGETCELIFAKKSHDAESSIARNIHRISKGDGEIFDESEIVSETEKYSSLNTFPLAAVQKTAVINTFCNKSRVSIMTGGPGTGKTSTIKAILYVHKQVCNDSRPLLIAPSARAARRMAEATGYPAQTIHSAVGIIPSDNGEEYSTVDTLDANIIIVDESSMADQYVIEKLLRATPSGCIILFVGDPDQLPSVAAGNVLLDMIKSNVIPVTKLEVIFRQEGSSPIVANAQTILAGNTELDYSKGFFFKECISDMGILKSACELYLACVKKFGIDNTVLLTPFRKKTDISVSAFNKQLQYYLNPAKGGDELTMTVHDTNFRVGDKVMQVKNTETANNGDIGYIRDICFSEDPSNEGHFTTLCGIEFNDDGQTHYYSKDAMNDVELAYATTVHKSQGSEYQTVIIIMSNSHEIVLKRNMIYTAITRASENVAIIGQKNALEKAILDDKTDKRCTFLRFALRNEFKASSNQTCSNKGGTDINGKNSYEQISLIA